MERGLQFIMKTWLATGLEGGRLGIQCPDTNCKGKAVVNKRKWIGGNSYKTRSCTYCFKTFLIPTNLMTTRKSKT